MVFIFYSSRICRNVSCLSASKLSILRYSTRASLKKETVPTQDERSSRPVTKAYIANPTIADTAKCIPSPYLTSKVIVPDTSVVDDISKRSSTSKTEEEWRSIEVDTTKLRKYCLMLSKIRLTSLVVVTTMGGYALAPGPFDPYTFLACSVGTGLVSATANAVNQFFEVPFDAQMSRTKNRVLVRGYMTPAHAVIFAAVSGVAGLSLLGSEVNGVTTALGATNLILYTLIYTPMKRISILNTWVGSIVGAIPPLMGWAACVGDISSPGAWIMSGILYAWQFPHFNALSWNLRPDYSRAGYRMMAVTNPDLCRSTTLRYTVILTGLCYLAPVFDVTNWWFSALSTPVNAYFLYLAWRFYKHSDSGSSRKLFRFSLVHLPVLMVLMLVTKKHWFVGKKKEIALDEKKKTVSSPMELTVSA